MTTKKKILNGDAKMNKTKKIELSHVLETLMYDVYDDNTPCEAGLYCPFYDNANPCAYCANGNCVEGMTKYIIELCET